MTTNAKALEVVTAKATCSEPHNTPECKRSWGGSKKDLALLLITKAHFESAFARNVQFNECKKHECDAYRDAAGNLVFRSRSLWQIQRADFIDDSTWSRMGSGDQEGVETAALVATRLLAGGFATCKTVEGAFAAYAGRSDCRWKDAATRADFYDRLKCRTVASLEDSVAFNQQAVARREKQWAVEEEKRRWREAHPVASSD
jgi:hypothetical protein